MEEKPTNQPGMGQLLYVFLIGIAFGLIGVLWILYGPSA
jgi:hypothetical protein